MVKSLANQGTSKAPSSGAGNVSTEGLEEILDITTGLQSQLNAKQAAITGAASSVVSANLGPTKVVVTNASGKLGNSAVTTTELAYLAGTTSSVQTQLNALAASGGGGGANVVVEPSRVVVSDVSGLLANSAVSTTELGFLTGTTSGIQTQLNALAASGGGGGANVVVEPSRVVVSDLSGLLANSSTTTTELGFLIGTTAGIQTQLDAKQSAITGAASSLTTANLVPDAVLVTNASGKVSAYANVNTTELETLHGARSNLQQQLDARANVTGATFTGKVNLNAGANIGQNQMITWGPYTTQNNMLCLYGAGGTGSEISATSVYGFGVNSTRLRYNVPTGAEHWFNVNNSFIANLSATAAWFNVPIRPLSQVASRALALDASQNLVTSATTSTELGYVAGTTSALQTQLNTKLANAGNGALLTELNASAITTGTLDAGRLPSNLVINDFVVTNALVGDGSLLTFNGLGIGTALPTANLHVVGNVLIANSTSTLLTIESSGLTTAVPVILSSQSASRVLVTDGSKGVVSATTTATELGFLAGTTAAVQTQLNALAAGGGGGNVIVAEIVVEPSRVVVSDVSGLLANSSVTTTELAYLAGTTAGVQTQLDAKQATLNDSTVLGNLAMTTLKLPGNTFVTSTSGEMYNVEFRTDRKRAYAFWVADEVMCTIGGTSYPSIVGFNCATIAQFDSNVHMVGSALKLYSASAGSDFPTGVLSQASGGDIQYDALGGTNPSNTFRHVFRTNDVVDLFNWELRPKLVVDRHFVSTLPSSIEASNVTSTHASYYVPVHLPNLAANSVVVLTPDNTLANAAVTTTELGYLTGTTAGVQTQLNAKQSVIEGAASTVTTANLSANRVVVSDASGKLANVAVTTTELGYLAGTTSSIQTQLTAAMQAAQSGGGSVTLEPLRVVVSDASGALANAAATTTDLGYLTGTTASLQSQLNAKQSVVEGAASTVTTANLSPNTVVVSDASGKLANVGVTTTELGYLAGATSSIQSQLIALAGSGGGGGGSVGTFTINEQEFTTAGTSTWTKPAGALSVTITCIGAGGGGGSGSQRTPSEKNHTTGGAGGGGGGYWSRDLLAYQVGNTETVVVGAGGIGGASILVANSNGMSGGIGGHTYVGNSESDWKCAVGGGNPGGPGTGPVSAGSSVAGTGGRGGGTGSLNNQGLNGGSSQVGVSGGDGGFGNTGQYGAAGGGGGASHMSGGIAVYRGGPAARGCPFADPLSPLSNLTQVNWAIFGAGVASGPGGNGSKGEDAFGKGLPGSGGGGGGNSLAGSGGNGGDGGYPGGGGGGGAASLSGYNSGAGGNGAAGYVRIVTVCFA